MPFLSTVTRAAAALLLLTACVATMAVQAHDAGVTRGAFAPQAVQQAGQPYDLVVVGGTPGGSAMAVRAARQGLRVLLVNRSEHLGGMISGGLGVADTQYEGARAPIVDEFNRRVLDYYRTKYGENSTQYEEARPGPRHKSGDRMTFEAHVGERILGEMIAAEPGIEVWKGYFPVSVERAERNIVAVNLAATRGGAQRRAAGRIFADATYEADLAALAGVAYRIGREDRNEYGEPHAGRIFSKRRNSLNGNGLHPTAAAEGLLNLRPFVAVSQEIFSGSTGEGDDKIPAYNYRLCVTRDPANRRYPDPPAGYDRQVFIKLYGANLPRIGGNPVPNQKGNWWVNPSCENESYPGGSWEERAKVEQCHLRFAVGVLYFLQNDPSVPEDAKRIAREWGLCKDEFTDNDNLPYEMYVREARRIVGRHVFTEHDGSLARGYERTPIHSDSIAIGEWFMDSHEVSEERQPGSDGEGILLLSEKTRPSQIPYRSLLPKDIDNLLVPVALSASHVGWGTIRLEPTWMHISESAGFAAWLAIKHNTSPGKLSASLLCRTLAEAGVMLSFFNDFDVRKNATWVAAVQYLGAQGFFVSYDAYPDDLLLPDTAEEWARGCGEIVVGRGDPAERARALMRLGASDSQERVTAGRFAAKLSTALAYWDVPGSEKVVDGALTQLGLKRDAAISRGDACRLVYHLLGQYAEMGLARRAER